MTKVQSQDIDNKAFLTTGTAPNYEITIPREASYADMDRQKITVNLHANASAAITFNVNGLGAKALVDSTGSAITTATADDYIDLIYDVSQDVFVGSTVGIVGGSGAGGAAGIISETFSTAANFTTETLTVTHNLGYTPTAIELNSWLQSQSHDLHYTPVPESKGYYLNGIQKNITKVWNNEAPDAVKWHASLYTNIGYLRYSPSSSTNAYMNINIKIINITTTTFDIEFSKSGGTAYSVTIRFFGLIIK